MSPVMEFPEIQTPYISLLVSGGHSMIVDVKERGVYEILGQSQDDAVGAVSYTHLRAHET